MASVLFVSKFYMTRHEASTSDANSLCGNSWVFPIEEPMLIGVGIMPLLSPLLKT
jgi:hypothetical protein